MLLSSKFLRPEGGGGLEAGHRTRSARALSTFTEFGSCLCVLARYLPPPPRVPRQGEQEEPKTVVTGGLGQWQWWV